MLTYREARGRGRERGRIRERKTRTKPANGLNRLRREGQSKSNPRQAINGHSIYSYLSTNLYKASTKHPSPSEDPDSMPPS